MRSRAVRLTLTLLAVLAIPAAAYFIWDIEQRETARHRTMAAFESSRVAALRDAFELRSAQQAYVAAGQSEAFWFDKVATLRDGIRASLQVLRTSPPSDAAEAPLDEAAGALQQFEQIDRRARNYAATGQKLLASDIVFSDGLASISRVITSLEQAGSIAAQADALDASRAQRAQLVPLAAAAAVMVLVLLLLAPRHEPRSAATSEAAAAPAKPAEEPAGTLDLRPARREAVRPAAGAPDRAAASPVAQTPPVRAQAAAPSSVDVQTLAGLCTDLARLSDTDRLPSILERTSQALDASGLILWVSDPDGTELVPVAAHGYPASVLARLGTIKADAANATAAAFRTGLLQTVGGQGQSSGAIAAPLVTASGCRGVMSAEVRNSGEKQPTRLAAAAIVAAQLATLVGPMPAAAADGREAAM